MKIKRFNYQEDYDRVIDFLRKNYEFQKNMVSWLPQRFDDLIFRVDVLYRDERGQLASQDYIYIFEEDDNIVGTIIPDGDSFNSCIKKGYEDIFEKMLDLAEVELQPLFKKEEDGSVNFLVISHDSLTYQAKELEKRGYKKDLLEDYDNVQHPLEKDYKIELPRGYKQVYGYQLEDNRKAKACHYGFHSEEDDGLLTGNLKEGALSYQGRKNSQFYKDSFESLIVTGDGDICSYCFCYVDKVTSTAFIEPLCTREKYRHMGFSRQMLYGVIMKLKEMNIESAYINSYAWRKKVYNSAGFETEDSIGFWYKKLNR